MPSDQSRGPSASGNDRRPPARDGIAVVDKPSGLTSHDVVARMRRLARTRKVGHAGTLDPMATGVLVLGVGAATRLLHHLVLADKGYAATIRLGRATVTDDAEGEVTGGASAAGVVEPDVRAAIGRLTGEIMQVPSAVSAIKVDGQRAYKRVRAGDPVELAARPVTVARFDLLAFTRPEPALVDLDVVVECSSGTYVRALARDLGADLGVGGHLTALRRTRVGPFTLERARPLDELADLEDPVALGLAEAIRLAMPVRTIDPEEARELSFGRSLAATGFAGTYGALAGDGTAVALLRESEGRARPVLVFTPAG
jgi:tRNA pseudouridine55 synthase